jgi:hypothetical protein
MENICKIKLESPSFLEVSSLFLNVFSLFVFAKYTISLHLIGKASPFKAG